MDHVTLWRLLPVLWMYTISIILQAHLTIHNLMDLLKSMYRLWRIYFKRQMKRVKIYSNACWSTSIHLLVSACIHWCKACRVGVQDLTFPCLLYLDSSLVYSLISLEMLIRMNIFLQMTYRLVKSSCIKILQACSSIQPLLPAYVCSQEVTTFPQGKVSPTGRHSPTNHKGRSQKMNILMNNLVICGH